MGVTVSTPRYNSYSDILLWLGENVGRMLHAQPNAYWHGDGWYMKASFTFYIEENRMIRVWQVEFDDEQQATAFALKWA